MRTALLFILILLDTAISAQGPYVGTSLGFADYLERRCGIVYKEDGIPADPFESMARHGATLLRIHVGHPPYASSYSEGLEVDHHSVENAKISMQRVKDAGLRSLLTFTYQSFALEDEDNLNIYVAPLDWQTIALDLGKITDSVYRYTYAVLDEYCSEDLVPEIVSIGAESTWHRLMPNVPENELPPYDPARSVALHNAGSRAVRDIALKYDTTIKVCFHMRGPATTKWWLEEHWPHGPDLDMIGISLYYGWNFDDYAGYNSLGEYVETITGTYGIGFIVMETAQLFREGGSDSHVDILGTDLIPPGYPNPPATETQKQYLSDLTREVLDHGGSGVLVWGGDWVASDCYIYADQWGIGSSWENKAFWDFDYNLHDGVNWMMTVSGKVPVTFKVDMTGADTSHGVYVTGEFEDFHGEQWTLNRMEREGNSIFCFTAYMDPGASGAFYFMNDTIPAERETIPDECTGGSGSDRFFEIPDTSAGEIIARKWSACDTISQYQLTIGIAGEGHTSRSSGMYSAGTQVPLLATPVQGWRFTGWSGDTISAANLLVIRMDGPASLVAHFEAIPKIPVTFRVDMTGVDVTNGVYVTGAFPNREGKTWQLNSMRSEGGNIFSYDTQIPVGSSGAYYFMNDDVWGVRESVPEACAVHWGVDRGYEIPENSTGETYAFVWSSCEEIQSTSIHRYTDPGSPEPLWEIFPNPLADARLNLVFHVADRATVSVLSLTGNLVAEHLFHTSSGSTHTVDLEQCSSGSYLVTVHFQKRNQHSFSLVFK